MLCKERTIKTMQIIYDNLNIYYLQSLFHFREREYNIVDPNT
jgi:hypothetical protein